MTTAELDLELENAAEAMAAPPRGQAGRFPARRLPAHLRRQGFLVTRHFLDRLLERAQAQGIRFDPRSFAHDFRSAAHFRQTRPGYNTRFALMHGLPVLYRMGGPRGLNPVLVGLLPQGALPPSAPVTPPHLREAELEQELEWAASELESAGPWPGSSEAEFGDFLYGRCTPCWRGWKVCRKRIVPDDGSCRYVAWDTYYCRC